MVTIVLERCRQVKSRRNVPRSRLSTGVGGFLRSGIRTLFFGMLCCSLFLLGGCEERVKSRPYGDMRIGPVADFAATETFLPDLRLLIRHDTRGYSVMSTLCTHDLTPLTPTKMPDGSTVFISRYSESRYTTEGKILHGPTEGTLPYYKLRVAAGVYGGVPDTLFVEIGVEVPPEWRLPG